MVQMERKREFAIRYVKKKESIELGLITLRGKEAKMIPYDVHD